MSADPELSDLLGDVVRSVDEDIAADPGCPDLAAVVARAHELDPQRVPAEAVAEVGQWAPVVSIQQGHRRRRTRDDVELLAVIEGVRAHVEEDVAQRLGTPPPVPAEPEPPPPRRVWGYVLAAAAVLLIVGAGVLQAGRWRLVRDDASPSEAPFQREAPSPERSHELSPHSPEPELAPSPESMPAKPESEPGSAPAEQESAEQESAAVADARRASRARSTKRLTLEELDAAAHAAWRAGDLPKAERLFRALAKRAGKDRLGDLAYGDLFTLARQTKSPRKEVALWREYLRRFPRGRFADDARAGLCRRAEGDAQLECWRRYLGDMPRGSHRAQAQRALGSGQDDAP